MTYFRITECGNSASEAFHRACGNDAVYGVNCGIRKKTRLVKVPSVPLTDGWMDGYDDPNTAYYIDKGDGEYFFFGTV